MTGIKRVKVKCKGQYQYPAGDEMSLAEHYFIYWLPEE